MNYVGQLLMKGERVLFDGRLHYIICAKGAVMLLLAAWLAYLASRPELHGSPVLGFAYTLHEFFPGFRQVAMRIGQWYYDVPDIGVDLTLLATVSGFWGAYLFVQALIRIRFTELVVTDRRVIAKTGMFNVSTIEFGRDRLAGVSVYQTASGRVLNYGWITLEGFSGDIGGLPPIANPHGLQKAANSWRYAPAMPV